MKKDKVSRRRWIRPTVSLHALTAFLLVAIPARDAGANNEMKRLLSMDFDQLMDMEITSVAKKPQRLADAAAAVQVITADDIRRSGATSLPDALRLVPGVHVAHIDGNKWAVGIRGMSARWAGQLLVLMDGRTLYSPLYSGVYWEIQDTLLEDIERIEVVRGPGGTLWGANAVNGVINIITKSAADTQGTLAYGRTGNQEHGGALRHGTRVGDNANLRAYLKWYERDDFRTPAGDDAHDGSTAWRGGFRMDGETGAATYTLQGDLYDGELQQTAVTSSPLNPIDPNPQVEETAAWRGFNLLGRWRHSTDNGEWQLQAYFDRAQRSETVLRQRIDTWDIEFQHRLRLGGNHDIVWGAGYRRIRDRLSGDANTVSFDPGERTDDLYNFFLQDEVHLNPKLRLTLGAKFENNPVSGMEPQPSARLLWQPTENKSYWAAWSRAVRTPSRADRDIRLNLSGFPLVSLNGSADYDTERMDAYEVGFRHQYSPRFGYDISAFYYDYGNLRTTEPDRPFFFPVFEYRFENQAEADSYGLEISAFWQPADHWQLKAGYAWLNLDGKLKTGSSDSMTVPQFEGSGPRHQAQLQSHYRLRPDLELDALAYYTGDIFSADAYLRLDLRAAWHIKKGVELSLVGQNLLDARHPEIAGQDSVASEVPRSVYVQLRWEQ